jgi:opacity protein-like surface antigen
MEGVMKKKGWAIWASLAVWTAALLAPASAEAFEVKFRLYGGYGYSLGGDLNSGAKGFGIMYADLLELMGGVNRGSFEEAHYGAQFGGDIIFMLSPNVGLGLGAESFGMSKASSITNQGTLSSYATEFDVEASAVPLKLSLFFCAPMGSGARLTLHGGVGYYLAKMSNQVRVTNSTTSAFIQLGNDAESQSIGFHGGLGFEFDLARNVSFFIEAQGRYAKLGGFSGEHKFETNGGSVSGPGDLYYYEILGFTGDFYSLIECVDGAPAESASQKNIREAKIDFSGLTALGGIIIRF